MYSKQYSGLACIDIDGQDNPHIRDWDQGQTYDEKLAICSLRRGLSCGGQWSVGISKNQEYESQKEDIFPIIRSDFKQFGIDVGPNPKKGGSDIRYYSLDSTPYINHEVYIYSAT